MAGLNTRKTNLAPDFLLNLSKTDLADILWGVVQQVAPTEAASIARLVEEARVQADHGDKPMRRAWKYLADQQAKFAAGHDDGCSQPKNGYVGSYRTAKVGGWACVPMCKAGLAVDEAREAAKVS